MLVDLSVKVSKTASGNALDNEKMASFGHLGTHFDVMNKEIPRSCGCARPSSAPSRTTRCW